MVRRLPWLECRRSRCVVFALYSKRANKPSTTLDIGSDVSGRVRWVASSAVGFVYESNLRLVRPRYYRLTPVKTGTGTCPPGKDELAARALAGVALAATVQSVIVEEQQMPVLCRRERYFGLTSPASRPDQGGCHRQGLTDVEVLFYHYHALPPMLEGAAPDLFRRASLAMEKPRNWCGHVMASALVLVGRRPT
jgi:hypothetical protein